jgi:hypothetical protein
VGEVWSPGFSRKRVLKRDGSGHSDGPISKGGSPAEAGTPNFRVSFSDEMFDERV